jgi:hypothetical protein
METEQILLDGNRSAISVDHPAEFWAPPLAPTDTSAPGDNLRLQEAFSPALWEVRSLWPDQNDRETKAIFQWRKNPVFGSAVLAALGVIALDYFWAGGGDKVVTQPQSTQATESAPPVQSSAVTPVHTIPKMRVPAIEPVAAVAWDLPPSITGQVSPQGAPAVRTATSPTAQSSRKRDTVFLQRPGVNIRSTPSPTGIVLGTAPKGTRFKVTSRDGEWVQVESGHSKGWVKAQFLAANEPP